MNRRRQITKDELKPGMTFRMDGFELTVGNAARHGLGDKGALYDVDHAIYGWGLLDKPGVVLTVPVESEPPLEGDALDRAIAEEVDRLAHEWGHEGSPFVSALEGLKLKAAGWTPPPPVDSAVKICREIFIEHNRQPLPEDIRTGRWNSSRSMQIALAAFRAGQEAGR